MIPPIMVNRHLVCTLLDRMFALGDFNATLLPSGEGLAIPAAIPTAADIRHAFTLAPSRLAVAAVPMLIPLVISLMRGFLMYGARS